MDNTRKDWVDYAKGIGIIMMVYGHLLSSGYHAGLAIPKHFFEISDSIVYSFHMPLFFLLSGLFVESSLQKRGPWEYLKDKLLRIAYPYFIWSILQMSVEVLFSSQTQKGAGISDILAIAYRPWGQFWFIYALFLMHFVYTLVSRSGKFTIMIMFIVGVYLFFNPIRLNVAALGGFSIQFIFFVCGIYLRRYLVDMDALSLPLWAIISLLVVLLGSGYFVFENIIEPTRLTNGLHPYYLLYFSALGIIACVSLSQYLAKKNILQFLKILGIYSLQIYLVHMVAGAGIRLILQQGFQLHNWVLHILLGVFTALLIPIVIQKISERINFPYLFELKLKK
jgi:fucose 4-O-acetylase-like acetyltransferase